MHGIVFASKTKTNGMRASGMISTVVVVSPPHKTPFTYFVTIPKETYWNRTRKKKLIECRGRKNDSCFCTYGKNVAEEASKTE